MGEVEVKFQPSYSGHLADAALYWFGSPNDAVGQIVISHEDIIEAARNPRVVAHRALRSPATLAIACAVLYTLYVNRRESV